METVYLGAGCFWCVEAVFLRLKGVNEVVSGYMGGHVKHPAYREVCTGTTGHAEVIKVVFDPNLLTLENLLDVFWTTHDPTTLNRQGADVGTQYRSVIFFTSVEQKTKAEWSKLKIATQYWVGNIVTEICPAEIFYIAEDYHQHFYENNPDQTYCSIVIPPKISKLNQRFSHLLK